MKNYKKYVTLCTYEQYKCYETIHKVPFTNKKLAEKGFRNVPFKGTPLVYNKPDGYEIVDVRKLGENISLWVKEFYCKVGGND